MTWTLIPAAYLLGSVPFALLVGKAWAGVDVRSIGSGNIGATNVLRGVGWPAALVTLVLDVAKGAIPVMVGQLLGTSPSIVGGAALAAVAGHAFPLFLGFRGGKGVAAACGALGAISPLSLVIGAMVFALVVAWKRYVSLASMVAAASFPAVLYLIEHLGSDQELPGPLLASCAAISVLVIARHHENLRRLLDGNESRLGERVRAEAP